MNFQSMTTTIAAAAWLLVWLVPDLHACSIHGQLPPPHTMDELLYAADIVVHATASTERWTWQEMDDLPYPAYFTIHCVFKDINGELPSGNISLAYNLFSTCSGQWPEPGKEYILGLQAAVYEDEAGMLVPFEGTDGMFMPYEPEVHESASFLASPDKLSGLLRLCGLQHPKGDMCPQPPQKKEQPNDDTPAREEGGETCIKAIYNAAADTATPSACFMAVLAAAVTML